MVPQEEPSNKCIATSNKGITTSSDTQKKAAVTL